MRDLTKEEREELENVSKAYKQKKNGYWCYVIHKDKTRKSYKRSRVLMQLYLNAKLEQWEIVHHINEKKWDDRISNLQVLDSSIHISHHHAGKRDRRKSKGIFYQPDKEKLKEYQRKRYLKNKNLKEIKNG